MIKPVLFYKTIDKMTLLTQTTDERKEFIENTIKDINEMLSIVNNFDKSNGYYEHYANILKNMVNTLDPICEYITKNS
jgi:hypothetical protein